MAAFLGLRGEVGRPGPIGLFGLKGVKGDIGPTGTVGPEGLQGAKVRILSVNEKCTTRDRLMNQCVAV